MVNVRFVIKMVIHFKVLSKIIIFNLDLIFQATILNIMVNLVINNLMVKENLFLIKFLLKVNFKTIFWKMEKLLNNINYILLSIMVNFLMVFVMVLVNQNYT